MNTPLLTGYLESWYPNTVTFTEAAKKGYTAIILAFGSITGSKIGIFDSNFNPSPTPGLLKEDIAKAKIAGAKHILFSVGGGSNNTYQPNNAPVKEVATALVEYCKNLGFTGVDFDIEIEDDGDYLNYLCAEIKSIDANFLITVAPQINQEAHETDLLLVSTGNHRMYDKTIQNGYVDYVFAQAYNNPWPTLNSFTQKDVSFISTAFHNLKMQLPKHTFLSIGEPSSRIAAGHCSIYLGPDAGKGIYDLIQDQYTTIMNDSQYGGVMTWSIHLDAKNGYKFLDATKSVIPDTVTL